MARIGDGEDGFELEGHIDRLAMVEDGLLILDYKTNRPPPKIARGGGAGLYRPACGLPARAEAAVSGAFLARRAAVDRRPRLMEIPSTSLDDAEQRMLQAPTEP